MDPVSGMTGELIAWLRAQLDHDERVAQAVHQPGIAWVTGVPGEADHVYAWRPDQPQRCSEHPEDAPNPCDDAIVAVCQDDVGHFGGDAEQRATHIALYSPSRALAEIAAKRQIIDAYLPPGVDPHPGQACINHEGQDPAHYDEHDTCWRHLGANRDRFHGDHVLRLLALPYADRLGYREDWKP